MIVLRGMAEFVHYDVFEEFRRQESETVVEAQVPFRGAASPPRLLLSYGNSAVSKSMEIRVVTRALGNERTGSLYGFFIRSRAASHAQQLDHDGSIPFSHSFTTT